MKKKALELIKENLDIINEGEKRIQKNKKEFMEEFNKWGSPRKIKKKSN